VLPVGAPNISPIIYISRRSGNATSELGRLDLQSSHVRIFLVSRLTHKLQNLIDVSVSRFLIRLAMGLALDDLDPFYFSLLNKNIPHGHLHVQHLSQVADTRCFTWQSSQPASIEVAMA